MAALLDAGADVISRDCCGMTPLTYMIDYLGEHTSYGLDAVTLLLAHETRPGRAVLSHELRRMLRRARHYGELEGCK